MCVFNLSFKRKKEKGKNFDSLLLPKFNRSDGKHLSSTSAYTLSKLTKNVKSLEDREREKNVVFVSLIYR